jgi:hypothetical protein
VVAHTNTVVYPGAVMVETLNADVADCTMSRSWCPDDLAVRTEIGRSESLKQFQEVEFGSNSEFTWISCTGHNVRDYNQ